MFNREGAAVVLLRSDRAQGLDDFQLPTGLFIDRQDHVYVVDSYNRRVQVFHYLGLAKQAAGGTAVRSKLLSCGCGSA